jgi:hypothetical protein
MVFATIGKSFTGFYTHVQSFYCENAFESRFMVAWNHTIWLNIITNVMKLHMDGTCAQLQSISSSSGIYTSLMKRKWVSKKVCCQSMCTNGLHIVHNTIEYLLK